MDNLFLPVPSGTIIPLPVECRKCHGTITDPHEFCPFCGKALHPPEKKHFKRPNGSGSVYKLQGRRTHPWIATKNKVVIGYYSTKKEALDALDKLIDTNVSIGFNMTFQQVYERWYAEHSPSVTDSRLRAYSSAYKIFESLSDRKFRDLRTADFQACIDSSNLTALKDTKIVLNQMYSWAIRNDICTTNYSLYIKVPTYAPKEKQIFTRGEIQKLIDDNSDDAKIALMMIYTGMRIGELFALTLEDYHDTYVIGGEKTEAGKNRIILIAPQARPYFAEFAAKSDCKLINLSYRGYIDRWNKMLDRLNISHKTPHSCRHTFASMMAANGMDPNVLKKIMGHSSIVITSDVYIHSEDDTLIHALDDFDLD